MPTLEPTQMQWPTVPGSGRGRSHGTSGSEPFDRWFRYPAGFASDYVSMLLDSLNLEDGGAVIDCFTGSGVTGTAARTRGLGFSGIEAHPMMAELAALKLRPTADSHAVRELSGVLLENVRSSSNPTGGTSSVPDHANAAETDLVQRSFTPDVLAKLVQLRTVIRAHGDEPAAPYLKWALLSTLRDVASVKVGWPYQRPGVARQARYSDPLQRFETRVETMAADLATLEPAANTPLASVVVGDSRDPAAWAKLPGKAAACVASPPYLNNFDYADATRLELYFWGEIRTWAEMCTHVRSDMVTATTQQSSMAEKEAAVAVLESLDDETPKQILKLVHEIEAVRRERSPRAKEYDRVTPAYFVAMRQILANLHAHLKPGASALWLVGDSAPYGVYVDTPRLIGELSTGVGFTFTDDISLRVRGNRWGANNDRHKVALSERLIILTRK